MSQPVTHRVLVVDDDARVRSALAALIEATPGLTVVGAVGSAADALAIGRAVGAAVVVVDVDDGRDDDVATIRELAEHYAVIAVGDATARGLRALEAGAAAVCEKDGDPDPLIAAVEAAATSTPTQHTRRNPMSHLELRARMTVRPGQLEAFKAHAAELMRLTRELDTHTLRYDWFISEDGTRCEVHEAYDSELGLFEHNEHIMAARAVFFRDVADDHRMTAYGEVSQRLVDLSKHHAGGLERFAFLDGLQPEPAI